MNFFLLLLFFGIVALTDGSVLRSRSKRTELTQFGERVGQSLEQLEVDIENSIEAASRIRGAPGTLEDVFVAKNVVLKIRFPDGKTWAAKRASPGQLYDMVMGINALIMVEECCPNIPISKVEGWNTDDGSMYYFTEWAEGETLDDLRKGQVFPEGEGILVRPKIISSLAEFMFNLSMCEIPWTERIYPELDSANWQVPSLPLPVDQLSEYWLEHVPDVFQPLEFNATTWARLLFLNHKIFSSMEAWEQSPHSQAWKQNEPYDGLDTMVLLAWVVKAFAAVDALHEPFTLHYWDLQARNIVVSAEDEVR
jgi:hypothetical protein